MYTTNPKAITKLAKWRYTANKPKEARWNPKTYGINPKEGIKGEKREKETEETNKTNSKMADLNQTVSH